MKSEGFFLIKYGTPQTSFELRPFEVPAPKENEVVIEVESFGLNYADIMARNKLYREAPPLPCILGYEIVGKVIISGDEHNNDLIGKRVLAFTRFGGYAKHVIASVDSLIEIDQLPSNQALALATQYTTAYFMSEYLAPIYKGEHVLIHAAAGGVGTALIQLAKRKGAIVYAKVSSEEKCNYVQSLGADYIINYTISDYRDQILKITGGRKLDVIFNPVGGSTYKKDLSLLAAGGKLFLYGGSELLSGRFRFFSSLNFIRKMGLSIPIAFMMKSKSILGINMLKIADERTQVMTYCLKVVFQLHLEGQIHIQEGKMFSYKELNEAHELLESGKSIGKIGINWKI